MKQNLNSGLARVNWQSNYAKKQKNRHGRTSVNRAQKQPGRHCQHILERNRDSARKRNQNEAASRNQRRKKCRQDKIRGLHSKGYSLARSTNEPSRVSITMRSSVLQ